MRLTVENLGSIGGRLEVPLARGGVTTVRGGNAAGKTTVCSALTACATGHGDPMDRGGVRGPGYARDATPEASFCGATLETEGEGRTVFNARGAQGGIVYTDEAGWLAGSGEGDRQSPALAGALARPLPSGRASGREWVEALVARFPTGAEVVGRIRTRLAEGEVEEALARQVVREVEATLATVLEGTAAETAETAELGSETYWSALDARLKSVGEEARRRYTEARTAAGDPATGVRIAEARRWCPKGLDAARPAVEEEEVAEAEAAAQAAAGRAAAARDLEGRVATTHRYLAEQRARVGQLAAEQEPRRGERKEPGGAGTGSEPSAAEMRQQAEETWRLRSAGAEEARTRRREAEEAVGQARRRRGEAEGARAHHGGTVRAAEARRRGGLEEARRHAEETERAAEAPDVDRCPTCGGPWKHHGDEVRRRAAAAREALEQARREDEAARQTEAEEEARYVAACTAAAGAEAQAAEAAAGAARALTAAEAEERQAGEVLGQWREHEAAVERRRKAEEEEERRAAQAREQRAGRLAEARAALEALEAGAAKVPTPEEAAAAREEAVEGESRARTAAEELRSTRTWQGLRRTAQQAGRLMDAVRIARKVVDPKRGMRKERVEAGAGRVARALDDIGEQAVLGGYTFDESIPAVRAHGRVLDSASEGEAWLAQAVVRLILTAAHGLPAVAVDRTEVLDPERRRRVRAAVGEFARSHGIAVLWTELAPAGADGATELQILPPEPAG